MANELFWLFILSFHQDRVNNYLKDLVLIEEKKRKEENKKEEDKKEEDKEEEEEENEIDYDEEEPMMVENEGFF